MFCGPANPCAICLPNYQPQEATVDLVKNLQAICKTEATVTEKKDRCWLCAVEVKCDEGGDWNGYITDEGVIYCFACDPHGADPVIEPACVYCMDATCGGWCG